MACVVAFLTALAASRGYTWSAVFGAFVEGCILTQHLYLTTIVNPLMKSSAALLKSYEKLMDAVRKINGGAK